MENKINIAKILKDCPKGTKLYSPLCGECYFDSLNMGTIICKKQNTQEITFTSKGYYMLPVFDDCECVLFPSKENRDWSKFQIPYKFDISTLKPFESRVLVRSDKSVIWKPAIYGIYKDSLYWMVGGSAWIQCIPYEGNEHLIGTTNDCDEFYKTWE